MFQKRISLLVTSSITLFYFFFLPPVNAVNCDKDSLKVLARIYPTLESNDSLTWAMADCFKANMYTLSDTILYTYSWRFHPGIKKYVIDSFLLRDDITEIEKSELYNYKGMLELRPLIGTDSSDALTALRYLDSALVFDSTNDLYWYNKGIVHLILRQFQESIGSLKKAVALEKGHIHYWTHYAVSLYYLGDKVEAKEAIDKTIQRLGGSFETLKWIADEFKAFKMYPEAIELYEKALKENMVDPDTWYNYAFVLNRDNSTKNITPYLDSVYKYCEHAGDLATYAALPNYLGMHEHALKFFNKSLSIDSTNSVVWMYKCQTLFYLNEYKSADACLEEISKYNDEGIFVDKNLFAGSILTGIGEFERALKYFSKVEEGNLDSIWTALLNSERIICYYRMGKFEEASAICDSVKFGYLTDSSIILMCDSLKSELEN